MVTTLKGAAGERAEHREGTMHRGRWLALVSVLLLALAGAALAGPAAGQGVKGATPPGAETASPTPIPPQPTGTSTPTAEPEPAWTSTPPPTPPELTRTSTPT